MRNLTKPLSLLVLAVAAGALAPVSPIMARGDDTPRAMASAPQERVLPLEGGRNFRELGGYRTADGHKVKWGLLYRSGSMTSLTPADYASLAKRGIRVVCDFRGTSERKAEPVNWPAAHGPRVLSDDYELDQSSFMPKGAMSGWTAQEARAALAASYPRMLVQFNGQYRRMFGELLAGHAPLAFNCSAGKDRTGIAAALLLSALGVPRESVIEDYLLTNKTLNAASLMKGPATANSPWMKLPPEVLQAFMGADRSYIEAALAVVDAHKDGMAGYLRDELGMGPRQIKALRRMYLD
jgi:protein-tyrosine phosphatase